MAQYFFSKLPFYQIYLRPLKGLKRWYERDYCHQAPRFIKEAVLKHYGIDGAPWVETGTFKGETSEFLYELSGKVFTIEPEPGLFRRAEALFKGKEIEVFNGTSEDVMPSLLPRLSGDINFWLDGHYSAGVTFKGNTCCPVEDELAAILACLDRFERVSILIDDVRCFLPENDHHDYPSIDYLVDWARSHKFHWVIEHDIFIMRNWH